MALNQWTDYRKGGNTIGIGVRIKHDSPDVANNRTRVYYEAYYYRIGNYNWHENPYTTGTLQIYGQTVYNNNRQLVNIYNQTQHIVHSGNMWVPHLANGTRQIAYNFTHDGSIVPPIDASLVVSGGYQLPDIPRVSKATLSKATFNFGESITVTTNRSDGSFTHSIFYVRNGVETSLATGVGVSGTIAIPNSLMTSYPNTTTANLVIRIKTYTSGSVMIGSHDIPVTVNIPSSITPNITGVTFAGSNAIFTANSQFIRDIDRLKATGSGVAGSNGSTVTTYQYRVIKGTAVMANMSSSANGATFPVFNFPNSGSDVYEVQMRVIDSRNRASAWVGSEEIRVHYYRAPIIGSLSATRVGATSTHIQVTRTHTVTSLLEGGNASQQKNTASLRFRARARGGTTWYDNGTLVPVTGANSASLTLSNSEANMAGSFVANTSYEVQAILSDKLNTVYSSIILVGGQFLPFSLTPEGAGVGKMHSGGPADLEVGDGGIISEGPSALNGIITSRHGGVTTERNMGSMYSSSESNNGVIIIKLPNRNVMFDGKITLRSYGYAAEIFVGGYTYTGSSAWYLPQAFGTVDGNNINVRFSSDGANRYILVGDTGTIWGGYLHVSVDNIHTGFGESFNNRCTVSLGSSYVGTINKTFTIYNQRRGHGSGLDADMLDGLHASAFAKVSEVGSAVTTGNTPNGRWYQAGNELLICTQSFSIADLYSSYTLTGSWSYPKTFAYAPSIMPAPRASLTDPGEILNGTMSIIGNATTSSVEIGWMRASGANFTASSRKYLTIMAIGLPEGGASAPGSEWRITTRTENIPFTTRTEEDPNRLPSESFTQTTGRNGTRTYTWEEEFVNGVSTGVKRNETSAITTTMVQRVNIVGTKSASSPTNLLKPSMMSIRYGMDLQKGGAKAPVQTIDSINLVEALIWDNAGGFRIDSSALTPNTNMTLAFEYQKTAGTLSSMGGETEHKWSNHDLFVNGVKKTGKWSDPTQAFVANNTSVQKVYMHIRVPNDASLINTINIQPNYLNYKSVTVHFKNIGLYSGHINPFQ